MSDEHSKVKSTVPLEDCDVGDKERFAVYRYFRNQWIAMLKGEDCHAISKQIIALFSADLDFQTIVFSRGLCKEVSLSQNGIVHDFINCGFVAHQTFVIRRITEEYNGQKNKAVYSLPRVISEIKNQREIITREMYVCVDGDSYDTTELKSYHRHKTFDELSQIDAGGRTRDDLIHVDYFRELRKQLDSSKVFRTYANKFLAHAADPNTRSGNESFRLNDLEEAYKDLADLTRKLSAKVLYGPNQIFLPECTCKILKHIDNPICPESKVKELDEFWQNRYERLQELDELQQKAHRPS